LSLKIGIVYVVAANCSIEVLAYSGYNTREPKYAYVKLNGVPVWQASWFGKFPELRGVTIMLVDPFSCTSHETRNFDTHDSPTAATELSNYLRVVRGGSIVVGVTADEPFRKLYNALSTLQELGVDVSDLQLRGSFAFAGQKGYPSKTVLCKVLTEEESHTAPAYLFVTITGITHATCYLRCESHVENDKNRKMKYPPLFTDQMSLSQLISILTWVVRSTYIISTL